MAARAWRLDPAPRTAERLSDCPLSLNGIAKGFIVERACDAAMDRGRGVTGVMLNVGGDLRVRGAIDGTIGIAAPWADSESSEPLALHRGQGPVGRHQRELAARVPDRRPVVLAHLRSPVGPAGRARRRRDGHRRAVASTPTPSPRSATCSSPRRACGWPGRCPGVECLIVAKDGRTTRSDGWRRYERPRPAWLASADEPEAMPTRRPGGTETADGRRRRPTTSPWNKDFELVVNFEINHPEAEAGRYRRPYVAVWVEDKDGNLGPDPVALGLDGRRRAVPVDARPEALVCRRPGPQAPRQEGAVLHDRPADPASPASTRSSGTARTTTASCSRPANTRSPSRPRASTGPTRASASR